MITGRQLWLLAHIAAGSGFIHGFRAGGRSLADPHLSPAAVRARNRALVVMAVAAWLAVVSGTWTVYSWYRAKPVVAGAALHYPQQWLVTHGRLGFWHEFGMEWKEHVGWLAPMLATTVAVVAIRHQDVLHRDWQPRRLVTAMFSAAVAAALIAAGLGAAINKVAPNQFLGL
ncbi:MAG TPA: hypothetical protein VHL53_05400 [Acidimicrobiia bacterium]|nr:hypothetical protein [Acidimicrobiia bacterium]